MNPSAQKFFFFFKLFMSLVYIALGLGILFNGESLGELVPIQYTPIIGLLLVAYGLFRGYRAYVSENKTR